MSISTGDILLARQKATWKVLCSLWVLGILLGFGFLSFLGWILAGFIAQSRRVWTAAALWGAATFVLYLLLMVPPASSPSGVAEEPWETILVIYWPTLWFGSLAHAIAFVRPVLKDRLRYKELVAAAALSPAPEHGETVSAPVRIDINSASPVLIASIPGITPDIVDAVIRARRSQGGFANMEDLTRAARLSSLQMQLLRRSVTFGPFDSPTWKPGPVDL